MSHEVEEGLDKGSIMLSDFLATVSAAADERSAHQAAMERIAMAMDAEVALIAEGSTVHGAIGFRRGRVPADLLAQITRDRLAVDIPGLGTLHCAVTELDGQGEWRIVTARISQPFTVAERLLLRSMSRVLGLALKPLRQLQVERMLRVELEDRQLLLEQLILIQKAVAARGGLQQVCDLVARALMAIVGDEIVVTRVMTDDGTQVLSSIGVDPAVVGHTEGIPAGVAGAAMHTGDLIVAEQYATLTGHHEAVVRDGVASAMAAPLRRNGKIAGALVVATRTARVYSEEDRTALQAIAEHVSIALNDQSATEATRIAYERAVHRATHDSLTELPNRRLAGATLEAIVEEHPRTAVMFIDIDRFKQVNDTWGHEVGDRLLKDIAAELAAGLRPEDTIARLSGDEFLLISPGCTRAEALRRADDLSRAIAHDRTIHGHRLTVTASIGVTIARPGMSADSVVRDADVAMYRAKQQGRGVVQGFDTAMRVEMQSRRETEQALRDAVYGDQLRLDYQPIIDVRSGAITSIEALIRWQRPDVGLVSPGGFLDIAEESGQMPLLGRWVLRQAVADLQLLRASAPSAADVSLNMNVSAPELAVAGFADEALRVLEQAGLPPQALRVELTETALMADDATIANTLRTLARAGVPVSIDDFGTGYSSLIYLQTFEVSELKIDRRFVTGLSRFSQDLTIVKAIIDLARNLGMNVVAEGVEEPGQLAALLQMGASCAQGYLLGRPAPITELIDTAAAKTMLAGAAGDDRPDRRGPARLAPARRDAEAS